MKTTINPKILSYNMAHTSYTIWICGLPNMYTLSPWACGPWTLGVHIKQTTHAHGIAVT